MRSLCLTSLLAAAVMTNPVWAGELTVDVLNVKDEFGQVRVAVCREAEFANTTCELAKSEQAFPATVKIIFADVAPGTYGIKAFHDRNNNGELDRGFMGFVPIEGYGFSRIQDKVRKLPEFAAVAVPVGSTDAVYEITLNYP
jgi:uncharacterized protein (DUF2141 family)